MKFAVILTLVALAVVTANCHQEDKKSTDPFEQIRAKIRWDKEKWEQRIKDMNDKVKKQSMDPFERIKEKIRWDKEKWEQRIKELNDRLNKVGDQEIDETTFEMEQATDSPLPSMIDRIKKRVSQVIEKFNEKITGAKKHGQWMKEWALRSMKAYFEVGVRPLVKKLQELAPSKIGFARSILKTIDGMIDKILTRLNKGLDTPTLMEVDEYETTAAPTPDFINKALTRINQRYETTIRNIEKKMVEAKTANNWLVEFRFRALKMKVIWLRKLYVQLVRGTKTAATANKLADMADKYMTKIEKLIDTIPTRKIATPKSIEYEEEEEDFDYEETTASPGAIQNMIKKVKDRIAAVRTKIQKRIDDAKKAGNWVVQWYLTGLKKTLEFGVRPWVRALQNVAPNRTGIAQSILKNIDAVLKRIMDRLDDYAGATTPSYLE